MVLVVDAVIVEPRLDAFGKVFVVVGRSILPLPQTLGHGGLVSCLESKVKGRVNLQHTTQVDIVRELMDKDILGSVRVARERQHILFRTRTDGVSLRAAEATGAGVPVILRFEASVFRNIGGKLRPPHDDDPRAIRDHRRPDIRALGQHKVSQVSGFLEGVVVDGTGGHNRQTLGADVFFVKRRQVQFSRRGRDVADGVGGLAGNRQQAEEREKFHFSVFSLILASAGASSKSPLRSSRKRSRISFSFSGKRAEHSSCS